MSEEKPLNKNYAKRVKRVGWIFYNQYCPAEAAEVMRRVYYQWKLDHRYRWFSDIKVEDKGDK